MKCMRAQKKAAHICYSWLLKLFFYFWTLFSTYMKTGTIKFFNSTKGFGFVVEDNSTQEVFIHISGLIDQVKDNDRVSFDTIDGKRGLNAINVKLV